MELLNGKNALVTGGTRGIGKAIAVEYAKQGANVVVFGTNEERAKAVIEELIQEGKSSQSFSYQLVDVSKLEDVSKAISKCDETLGGFDIVVNCAGVTKDKLLMRMSEDDWDKVIDVNLKSCYNICSSVVKSMMKKRAGKIINISSVIGLTGNPGQVNYSASKFGMIGFTRSLAMELGKRGICVNAIAPGFIETDMTEVLPENVRTELLKKIPMQKLGQPEDIANAAVFLASSMSGYVSGQTLVVDGGMLA